MTVSFDPEAGLVVIPTRLTGPTGDVLVRLALDTGATVSMINWDIIVMLGYDPASEQERVQMTTGSGVEFVPRMTVNKIEALSIQRESFPILCHTLPPSATVDGVLGLDFLRNRRLILDLREGTAAVE